MRGTELVEEIQRMSRLLGEQDLRSPEALIISEELANRVMDFRVWLLKGDDDELV